MDWLWSRGACCHILLWQDLEKMSELEVSPHGPLKPLKHQRDRTEVVLACGPSMSQEDGLNLLGLQAPPSSRRDPRLGEFVFLSSRICCTFEGTAWLSLSSWTCERHAVHDATCACASAKFKTVIIHSCIYPSNLSVYISLRQSISQTSQSNQSSHQANQVDQISQINQINYINQRNRSCL